MLKQTFPPVRRQRKSAQLWKQESRGRNSFFQMFLLSGKDSAVCLPVCLSEADVVWPSERSHSATKRLLSASADTSGRHVPYIASSLLFFSTLFSLTSNYKHMQTVSTSCCQANSPLCCCCFSLWAQHCGMLGDLYAFQRSPTFGVV